MRSFVHQKQTWYEYVGIQNDEQKRRVKIVKTTEITRKCGKKRAKNLPLH